MNIAASNRTSTHVAHRDPVTGILTPQNPIAGIPTTLFFNINALAEVLHDVGSTFNGYRIQNTQDYTDGIVKLDLNLCYNDRTDRENPKLRVAVPHTEGPFPFPIIEPGYEDHQAITTLVLNKPYLLPPKAIAAMLMVEFFNPVYCARRESLMKYVPETASLNATTNTYDVVDQLIANLLASLASQIHGTPEMELLSLLETPDGSWEVTFTDHVNAYAEKTAARIATKQGVEDYMALAEGRRQMFQGREEDKPGTGLNEFDLTLPTALAHVPWTKMTEEGDVVDMGSDAREYFRKANLARKHALERYTNAPGCCSAYQ